jgi:hypothetical protein
MVARLCRNATDATIDDFRIGEGADHDTGECKELWSIRGGSDGRLALDFSAGGFSVGANHMSTKSDTKSIECGASARLLDHSRGQLLEFSDGDDFSG